MKRVLVLPGTAGRVSSMEYWKTYNTIEREAIRRHLYVEIPTYPGQRGKASGCLSYASAVDAVLSLAREFPPDWIIGRSFGCHVAVGLLQSEEDWVSGCRGVVMWGPTLGKTWNRYLQSPAFRTRTIERAQDLHVHLASDFFDAMPNIEHEVRKVHHALRFARGSLDDDNSREDLNLLVKAHREAQPAAAREAVEIVGLKHAVIEDSVGESDLARYYWSLFEPIADRQEVFVL